MLPWHWYCCPNSQVSCFSFTNQNISVTSFGELPLGGLVGPVCPVLLPFLSAHRLVGVHALAAAVLVDFQMFVMSFPVFTLPAAYSAKEKITSEKKSKQGQQPWEGMTPPPPLQLSFLQNSSLLLCGGGRSCCTAGGHRSRRGLRQAGRLQLTLCAW